MAAAAAIKEPIIVVGETSGLSVLLVSVASLAHIRKMQHQSHHHCYSYIHSKTYSGCLGKFHGQIVLPD